jgi:predicted transcriptional regulator
VPAQRMTSYDTCMTMLSFRVDEEDAAAIQRWADELGIDRSVLLRDAVRQHLNRLAAENDVDRWEDLPLTDGESALATIADWGPAEDWQDWADATG